MSILRRFTDFVLQGRPQAMGVAFVCPYIPLLGGVGILVAALVTLRKSMLEGLLVTVAATAPYVFKFYSSDIIPDTMAYAFLMLAIVSNLLIWLFASLLRRYSSWSLTLELALLLGVVTVGLIHAVVPGIQGWWESQLTKYFINTAQLVSGISGTVSLDDKQLKFIGSVKWYATGLFAASMMFNVLLQVVLARWWQAVMFNPGGLRQELHQIRLSHIVGILFVVSFALSWLGSKMMVDVMPVFYAVFCVAGLSVMHSYFSAKKNTWVWLFVLYLLIVTLFPLSVVVMAIVAMFDIWMDLRKRWIKAI